MAHRGGVDSRKTMSIMSHIQELQMRLVLCTFVFIIAAALAYTFRGPIIDLLLSPLHGQSLIYLNPAGGFSFILLVSVYAGLAISAPVIVHQAYCFLRPILQEKVQRVSAIIFICSLVLLVAGIAFGYIFAIPGALNFLYEFAGEYVEASLTADSYLNFIVAYTLGLGLVFQLPLFLLIIHWIKPLTPTGLLKSERWVILIAFIAAAIITPTPDPLNQVIIALPIVVIYQLGVMGVLVSVYRSRRKAKIASRAGVQHPAVAEHSDLSLPISELKASTITQEQITVSDSPLLSIAPASAGRRRSIDGFLSNKPSRPMQPVQVLPARREPIRPSNRYVIRPYRTNLSLDVVKRPSRAYY